MRKIGIHLGNSICSICQSKLESFEVSRPQPKLPVTMKDLHPSGILTRQIVGYPPGTIRTVVVNHQKMDIQWKRK
jgi:hypothetical protein